MQGLTEKSREILEHWTEERNIKEVAKLLNLDYNTIRNNYFKHFKKIGYLNRVSRGRYIINKKGKDKLEQDLTLSKSKEIILELSKKKASNREIKKVLNKELNQNITDSALFSKIYRLRKEHNIVRRHIKEINKIEADKNFYELLGLILSDGYIGKYNIEFSNKDKQMLIRYKNIIKIWDLKNHERISGNNGKIITVHSIQYVDLINKYLNNKKSLSNEIISGDESLQNSFLKGLFSGDGCASISISFRKNKGMWRVEPCVSLAIKNTEIKNQVSQIFKNKGYQPNVGNKNIWLRKKNDILRFYKEIKFIEGSKIKKSKGFRGLEKNKLLAYIVKHLEIDKTLKELKKQKSKEKIVNHIREKSLNM